MWKYYIFSYIFFYFFYLNPFNSTIFIFFNSCFIIFISG